MSTLSERDRQELSMLLPWYANGTLGDEDSRKVEAALAQDEDLAREFDLVLEDQAAVIDLVSEEEVPSSMEERFKAALHAEPSQQDTMARPRDEGQSALARLVAILFPAKPRAYAFVAALLPIVAVVFYLAGSQQPTQYQTASGEMAVATNTTRVLVQFNADVAWTTVDAFLKDKGGQVTQGPTADGLYELEFQKADDLIEHLERARDVFQFVLPVN